MLGLTSEEKTILLSGSKRVSDALRILMYVQECLKGATCDECTQALNMGHGSCSPRFSELEKSGCLKFTGKRRRTKSGGSGRVCTIPEGTDFRSYLIMSKVKNGPKMYPGLTPRQIAILAAGESFLAMWEKDTKESIKLSSIHTLISSLERAKTLSTLTFG
jgi:hypothetical protein